MLANRERQDDRGMNEDKTKRIKELEAELHMLKGDIESTICIEFPVFSPTRVTELQIRDDERFKKIYVVTEKIGQKSSP